MGSKEEFVIQTLGSLLDEGYGEDELLPVFSLFHTKKDSDVEKFLLNYAIKYERTGAGRTFLVMNPNKKNDIFGYFTLGLNTLHFEDGIDDVPKAYEGLQLYNDNYLPVYALFLIGKNDSCPDNISMGKVFNEYGIDYIRQCKERVGGSILYIDCIDELVNYYSKLGFEFFNSHLVCDSETGETFKLNTMIRGI